MSDEDISDQVREIFEEASVVYTSQSISPDNVEEEVYLTIDQRGHYVPEEESISHVIPVARFDLATDPSGEYVIVPKPKHEEDRYR